MVEAREDRPPTTPLMGSGSMLPPPRWQRLIDALRRRDESSGIDEALAEALTLDRFVVLDRVGRGGMGAVFEAIDPKLDRTVALKICTLPLDGAAELIEHEARCLAQLAHPNVVAVHDVVRDGPDLILVMEYVEGPTLRVWQRTCNPSWQTILDRYCEAARGLAAAHERGLVHGDFKPDNVLLGDDGRVRVIDFGLARHSYDMLDDMLGLPGRGTHVYMAPERLRDQPSGVAADVYGFCVAVWESLFGARPFAGETIEALLEAIEAGQPRKAELGSEVPAAIEALLRRGLAKQASARPSSMAALIEAINDARERVTRRKTDQRKWLGRALFAAGWIATLVVLRREPVPIEDKSTPVVERTPDPVAQTLALALDAVQRGLPDSAIQYLELARQRARVDGDELTLGQLAAQAEALGDELGRRGDLAHAQMCWDVAGDIVGELPDHSLAAQRLKIKGTRSK